MKTILITGINGFLGSHVANQLKNDYHVVGLEIMNQNLWRIANENYPIYESNEAGIKQLFCDHKIDYIIHTATLYGRTEIPKSVLLENNILAPLKLLEKGVAQGITAFINTDSFFNDNKLTYSYLSEYSLTKKHLLEWIQQFQNRVKIINMKIFHMYGSDDSPTKFVTWVINQLKANVAEIDLTLGEQKRDFIYIDDVVSAFKTVCDNMEKLPSNVSFDIGTGKSITLKEFIETARNLLNSTTQLNFGALP
ncbi:MAG TPA: NAD-dependent epimerase/dehydratase family protein, partial [Bacteroidales bacterium]|nr:NAD-dependent epimerase/dehydratase family protein [Bacteroidales bacterium]